MSKPIKLHWSSSKPNFGDALSPMLCEVLSGREVVHASIKRCDMVAIGSLLHRVKNSLLQRRIHVWGSGFIEPQAPHHSKHYYHAVRGEKSLGIISGVENIPLGDPGLLADVLLEKRSAETDHRIGIICHYKDKQNPAVRHITEKYKDITEIDIFMPVKDFLLKLSRCEFILSSAMHGLIAADALKIPNAWIRLSDRLRGGDFKFHDYYSVFDVKAEANTLSDNLVTRDHITLAENYQRPGLERIRSELISAFPFKP